MLGLTLELTRGLDRPPPAPPAIHIVTVSQHEAFAIAPHAELGALALHLIYGNGGDTGTPAASLGQTFGGWRVKGYRVLPSIESDPLTGYSEIVYEGTGSQQIAINLAGVFGGMLHGLGAGAAYQQSAPDLSTTAMTSSFAVSSSSEIVWDSATATWVDTFGLTDDGRVTSSTTVALDADALEGYLDMTIVGAGFSLASLDAGETWIDLTEMAVNDRMDAQVASIVMRNPITGTTVTVSDDALALPVNVEKRIQRRSGDYKIYPNINPLPAGTNFGERTVNRSIVFGTSEPDVPPPAPDWTGPDGLSGWNIISGNPAITAVDVGHGAELEFNLDRDVAVAVRNRASRRLDDLTPGTACRVAITARTNTGSGSASTTFLAQTVDEASGSSQIGQATAAADVIAAGYFEFTVPADVTTVFIKIDQGVTVSGSTDRFYISAFGPVSEA